jgi:hypothetical protein
VQPSSLVFLVLIAIWAAYLLQHWVRRREYLATARSVDRFSAAMRVLERRNPLPELDLSAPRPRSYAISPARPSRPEVVVKRAQSPKPYVPMEPSPVVRPTRFFHLLAGMSARRVRGLSLLASLSLVFFVSVLTAFSVLSGWSVLVVLGVLAADVSWLRHVAVSERAAGGGPGRAGEDASPSGRPDARDPSSYEDEDEDELDDEPEIGARAWPPYESDTFFDPSPRVYPEPDPQRQGRLGSERTLVIKVPGAGDLTEPIELPDQIDQAGWAPVPVPPPTYTLKAKAAEPVPVTPAVTEPPAASAVTEPQGTECWSLDGMVYDCELDELVERRHATGA